MLPATLFAGGFRGNAPDARSIPTHGKCEREEDGEGSCDKGAGEEDTVTGVVLEDKEAKGAPVKWNWHDSVKVQGAEAVRQEKVRMLALEGVRFGSDGKLEGGVGAVWRFSNAGADEAT